MASIPDNYEVNVAIKTKAHPKGEHWCKMQLPDTFQKDAEEKLRTLRSIFGDHFKLSMTHWECRGHHKEEWEDE